MLCEAQARGVTTPEESGIEVSEEAILELPLWPLMPQLMPDGKWPCEPT